MFSLKRILWLFSACIAHKSTVVIIFLQQNILLVAFLQEECILSLSLCVAGAASTFQHVHSLLHAISTKETWMHLSFWKKCLVYLQCHSQMYKGFPWDAESTAIRALERTVTMYSAHPQLSRRHYSLVRSTKNTVSTWFRQLCQNSLYPKKKASSCSDNLA